MSTQPIDPNDIRLGVPPEKFGALAQHFAQPGAGRVAVMLMLFPPVALRDADRATVLAAVFGSGTAILYTIADEIYKSYTSDPLDNTATQNLITALQGHLKAEGP